MKHSIYLLLFFVLTSTFCSAQRTIVRKVVKKMIKVNQVHHEAVGFSGEMSDQYRNYIKLKSIATETELLALTREENAVVRCYAAWALADRKYSGLEEVFEEIMIQDDTLTTFRGCIMSQNRISVEVYHRIWNGKYYAQDWKRDSLYYRSSLEKMDQVVLNTDGADWLLLFRVFANRPPLEKDYERIRQLALEQKNKYALIALAKFNKEEDIPGILAFGEGQFIAMAEYPNEVFSAYLAGKFGELGTEGFASAAYLQAIAAFQDTKSRDLLQQCLMVAQLPEKEFLFSLIHAAVSDHKDPIYDELMIELWERYGVIGPSTFDYLQRKKGPAFLPIVENGLLNTEAEYTFLDEGDDYGSGDAILPKMLALLSDYDSAKWVDILNVNIRKSAFTDLSVFTAIIEETQPKGCIESLFASLTERSLTYDIFALTKAILSYGEEGYNRRLIKMLEEDRSWDGGTWGNNFRALFKENGIILH